MNAATTCLWIAVLITAVGVGGNLFQMIAIDPIWSASPPESLHFLTSGPLFEQVKEFH